MTSSDLAVLAGQYLGAFGVGFATGFIILAFKRGVSTSV